MKYLPLAPIILALALCGGCDDPFGGDDKSERASSETELSSQSTETLMDIVQDGTGNTIVLGDQIITVTSNVLAEARGVLVDRGVL